MKSEILESDSTRSLYYKVADSLPSLVEELKILAARGDKQAQKELPIFKKMLATFEKSELGKIL